MLFLILNKLNLSLTDSGINSDCVQLNQLVQVIFYVILIKCYKICSFNVALF